MRRHEARIDPADRKEKNLELPEFSQGFKVLEEAERTGNSAGSFWKSFPNSSLSRMPCRGLGLRFTGSFRLFPVVSGRFAIGSAQFQHNCCWRVDSRIFGPQLPPVGPGQVQRLSWTGPRPVTRATAPTIRTKNRSRTSFANVVRPQLGTPTPFQTRSTSLMRPYPGRP